MTVPGVFHYGLSQSACLNYERVILRDNISGSICRIAWVFTFERKLLGAQYAANALKFGLVEVGKIGVEREF